MKNNRRLPYILGGVAAAVLIVAVVLILALGGGSGKQYQKHYEAAQSAFLQKDYDKALTALDKAMDIEATEECYLLMADVYYAQGDTDMAIQVLYLGYSHTGGEDVSRMLEQLKAESAAPPSDGEQPGNAGGDLTVAGETFAPDTASVLLSGRGLGNEDLRALSALTAPESLSLSDNAISDLSPLAGLQTLTSLQLSNNRISDLSPLAGLSALKTLYIDGNPITDFTPLERLSALRTLSMKNIHITQEQLDALQDALPDCRIHCDEPSEEIPEITLGGRTFRSDVTELNLGGLDLTDVSALSECRELRELDLRDNKITDITPLAELTKLERLCLWNNQVEDLLPLLGLTSLTYLDIDTNAVTDVIVVSQLTDLEELWLNNNDLAGVAPLRSLTKLTRLGLKNVGLTDDAFEVLKGLSGLKELNIEENEGLSQAKFDELQAALPKCSIAHSALVAEEAPPEAPEDPAAEVVPDETYVSVGADAAANAAGSGTGYAIIGCGTDAVAAGIRKGFLAQAQTLGMNVVADLAYTDLASEAANLVIGLRVLGADVLFVAADDAALSVLLTEAAAIGYSPQIIQVY